MSQNSKTKYHVRKRLFINRDAELPAFIIGIVENTSEIPNEDSSWKWGKVELEFGDCYRRVSFDFDMETREERSNSLYKINRIAAVVNAVREAIENEVRLLNKRHKIKEKLKKTKN